MIAKVALTTVGAYQSFDAPKAIQNSEAAPARTTAGRTRPVPTRGSRSVMLPRSGRPRPRMTRTTMITRNGTASGTPGRCWASRRSVLQCWASDWVTPRKTPPTRASG